MMKLKTINFLLLALSVFVFSGCDVPDSSYAKIDTDPNSVASDDSIPSADTSRNTDTEAERMKVTDGYVKGFDASYVDYYETDQGLKYYDTDGTQKDFFTILKKHGVNTVRLRIWVDPENAVANGVVSGDDSWTASGMNTLERTLRLAKRAKDNNLKVMLDFHYSDYWTDPGKQVIPYSWQSITTANAMAEKISDYTKEVLNAMKDADVLPDYVQVGNEVDSGLLLHTSYNGSSATAASSTVKGTGDNFSKYLKAGCDAVREISQDIKIIIHVTNRKPLQILTKSISDSLDYDIVGLSYYPWEDSHGTISSLRDNVTAFRNTYGKEVMVVESSMYWNYG
ncbi:MAG: glycosyl hydrolase 53 family protein, partial [Treponema sp.]|nr:glycosyl hydrolase 53 family protein [Treponema sp.]